MHTSPVQLGSFWSHPDFGEAEAVALSESRLMDHVLLHLRDGRYAMKSMRFDASDPLPGWRFVRGPMVPESYDTTGQRILERAMKNPPPGIPETKWRRVIALLGERRAKDVAEVGWPASQWFVRMVTEIVCAAEGVTPPPSPCPEFPLLTVEPLRL